METSGSAWKIWEWALKGKWRIRIARAMNLFTLCYVFTPEEARAMAGAGVDVLVAHLGLTSGGSIGSKRALRMEAAAPRVQEMIENARDVKRDIICLAHGGPISSPEDTANIYRATDAVGFVGASSIERIPVENAVRQATEAFKSVQIRKKTAT